MTAQVAWQICGSMGTGAAGRAEASEAGRSQVPSQQRAWRGAGPDSGGPIGTPDPRRLLAPPGEHAQPQAPHVLPPTRLPTQTHAVQTHAGVRSCSHGCLCSEITLVHRHPQTCTYTVICQHARIHIPLARKKPVSPTRLPWGPLPRDPQRPLLEPACPVPALPSGSLPPSLLCICSQSQQVSE